MASLIGALRVTLGIDTAEFSSGMVKAESQAKRSMTAIKGFLGGFASGIGIAAITDLASRSLEYVSSLAEVAQQLGVTTDELQEYRYAASQVGIEQQTMDKGLAKLSITLGELASGAKGPTEALKRLGMSEREIADISQMTAGQALPVLADAFARLESPTAQAAAAADIFGAKLGPKFLTLLAGGAKGLNGLRDAAHRLGNVLSAKELQDADELADKLTDLKLVLEAKIGGAIASNTGMIMDLANAFAALVDWAGRAAKAYKRYRLEVGVAQQTNIEQGWFTSDEDKAKASKLRGRMQAELASMDRKGPSTLTMDPLTGKPREIATAKATQSGSGAGGSSGGGSSRGGGGGPSGPSETELAQQFNDRLVSYAQQALSSMQALAANADDRAEYELRSVEMARLRTLAEVDEMAATTEKLKGLKERLRQQVEVSVEYERERIEFQRQAELERQATDIAEAQFTNQQQALRDQYDLATTQAERRDLAGQMLDLEYQHRASLLEQVTASKVATDHDKARARIALDGLNQAQGTARELMNRDTAGPLESYLRGMTTEAGNLNEAMEQVAVGGLQSLNDGILDAIMGAKSLGDMFSSVAKQIIADLMAIQLRKMIVSGLSSVIGGLGSSVSSAAASSGISTKFGIGGLPKFANGGVLNVGGNPGVDTNLLSINGRPRALVSAGEQIAVIPPGGGIGHEGGRTTVQIVPSKYFDAHVDGRAAAVARPMAIAVGVHATGAAVGQVAQRGRRKIPG